MLVDLRLALRRLGRHPGFTALAALTLALGIGATTAVFTLVEGVLLTPPPYPEPDRLVIVQSVSPDGKLIQATRPWAAAQWLEWQRQADSLEAIAPYSWNFDFLVRDDGAQPIEGMRVSADYFRVIGVEPVLGRPFLPEEFEAREVTPILIGHELWKSSFDSDPAVLGRTVRRRGGAPAIVVGVMPAGMRFLPSPNLAQEPNYDANALVDFWAPAAVRPQDLEQFRWNVVARLAPGATVASAEAELRAIAERQVAERPVFAGMAPVVEQLAVESNREPSRILWPLFGAAALVLLIACGNTAALLLVRGAQRRQEYAVRSAMGVGRATLIKQASVESLLLALLGGGIGVALAFAIVDLFREVAGQAVPRLDTVSVGWPVLAWAFAAALASACLAGVAPALRASRVDPAEALKSDGPRAGAGTGERRVLRAVTTFQTALTLVLLVGAGLLLRTMVNLVRVDSGFETRNVLSMSVTAVEGSWSDFHTRALERVSSLPGVEHAAFAWGLPLTGNNWPAGVDIEGQPEPATEADKVRIPLRSVTPGYFTLLGQTVAQGRDIRADDNSEAPPVAVVNQAFADRYFPGSEALGRKLWSDGRSNPPHVIVGVVSNSRTEDLARSAQPEVYLSLWQARAFSKHLVIRTAGDPDALVPAVQRELRDINPSVAVADIKTLADIQADSLAARSFAMNLLVAFAAVATVLTLVGIYGVLALAFAARRREIAIRSAIGAQQRNIRRMVLAEGVRLVGIGVGLGIVAALALSRFVASMLFDVQATDPLTLAGVAAVFAIVVLAACWAPARRAARVNPAEALRAD